MFNEISILKTYKGEDKEKYSWDVDVNGTMVRRALLQQPCGGGAIRHHPGTRADVPWSGNAVPIRQDQFGPLEIQWWKPSGMTYKLEWQAEEHVTSHGMVPGAF